MTPSLKLFFVVSYVVLAPLVGAFADSMPKGRVMFITNAIKIVGCSLMLFSVHPLAGLRGGRLRRGRLFAGQVRHPHRAPAADQLVVANGWIEGTTVGSIILGVLLGGVLISHRVSHALLGFDMPLIDTGIDTPPEAAIAVIMRCSTHRRDHSTGTSRTPASITACRARTRST